MLISLLMIETRIGYLIGQPCRADIEEKAAGATLHVVARLRGKYVSCAVALDDLAHFLTLSLDTASDRYFRPAAFRLIERSLQ